MARAWLLHLSASSSWWIIAECSSNMQRKKAEGCNSYNLFTLLGEKEKGLKILWSLIGIFPAAAGAAAKGQNFREQCVEQVE